MGSKYLKQSYITWPFANNSKTPQPVFFKFPAECVDIGTFIWGKPFSKNTKYKHMYANIEYNNKHNFEVRYIYQNKFYSCNVYQI